tara:strand:- start:762 stop:1298 length:537 start_codon:yes stop_codon:yes gene_type:complete
MMIEFNESFPVHTETLTNTEQLNIVLEKDIRKAGDGLSGRNPSAQCLMTTWDMHKHYQSFELLGDAAIRLAKLLPLATRTHEDGTDYPIDYKVSTSWGLIYSKGQHTGSHTHWPDIWSWTYCVKASKDCSPLVFTHANHSIKPVVGQMTIFPGWLHHEVPTQTCDYERIMIAGNLVGL